MAHPVQVECFDFRLLQSAKLAASEFGVNRAATPRESEETNAAENVNDDDAGDDDDDDDDEDEKVERNVDYECDEEDKAELSDSADLGIC